MRQTAPPSADHFASARFDGLLSPRPQAIDRPGALTDAARTEFKVLSCDWQTRRRDLPDKTLFAVTAAPSRLDQLDNFDSSAAFSRLKPRVLRGLVKLRGGSSNKPVALSPQQQALFPGLAAYLDLVYLAAETPADELGDLRELVYVHVANHVLVTRDRVLKNTQRLRRQASSPVGGLDAPDGFEGSAAAPASESGAESDESSEEEALEAKREIEPDQGFTRPRILVLAPMRNAAFRAVETLVKLLDAEQVENHKRFVTAFGPAAGSDGGPKTAPEDHRRLFAGNTDDCFRIGLKVTRKAVKLFADFHTADVVVASPLGLRTLLERKGADADFLSSIEVVVLEQPDVLEMQNWSHVTFAFEQLNQIPRAPRDTDFSRVRAWCLDGRASLVRQTLAIGGLATPAFNALISQHFCNVDGRIRVTRAIPPNGRLGATLTPVAHVFVKMPAVADPADVADARFEHFVSRIVPQQLFDARSGEYLRPGTVVVVPSYFDFVRLRNWMDAQSWAFGQLSEYRSPGEISRTRAHFFHGTHKIVLVTERFHFYHRYRLRGARHVLFYSVPTTDRFYPELVACIGEAVAAFPAAGRKRARAESSGESENAAPSCTVLFSEWELLALERLVGRKRARAMVKSRQDIFCIS